MKTYAPNYYTKFKCIAEKCAHSCCIGWDVYLDDGILKKYRRMRGALGDRIRASLKEKDDGVCFEMQENGNCPFLDSNGLCQIILEKGESCISEICREHPRFYNCFSDRYEVGLGLSCEEAARIILSQTEITEILPISEDGSPEDELWDEEIYVFETREKIFSVLQNRNIEINDRIEAALSIANAKIRGKSAEKWLEILLGLEQMNPEWGELLKRAGASPENFTISPLSIKISQNSSVNPPPSNKNLANLDIDSPQPQPSASVDNTIAKSDDQPIDFSHIAPLEVKNLSKESTNPPLRPQNGTNCELISPLDNGLLFEKLLLYFIYRHTATSEDKSSFAQRLAFSVFSTEIIFMLWESTNRALSFDALCNIARLYSAEIEYSEENNEILLGFFEQL